MLIENRLRANPYVSEAVVFGRDRPYLSALIEIDFETAADWASRNNIPFTGFASLIESAEMIKFMGAEMERVNKLLSRHEQIKAFRILPKELSPAEDEATLTSTRKMKRDVMYNRFRDLIESMYHNNQDGKNHLSSIPVRESKTQGGGVW